MSPGKITSTPKNSFPNSQEMIVTHALIKAMNENDEPCLELNEMNYRQTEEFWKQAYYHLLNRQKLYEPDLEASVGQSISKLSGL